MAIQQIQPRSNFPISRLLPDLGDGVTYFVQAIVRNATTNAVIATVALPIQGSRIYGALWRTPADSSGLGLYVTITTTAFFDALYTSPATSVYAAESSTYILFDQYNYIQQMSTQIAAQITIPELDYKKIKKIIVEAVNAIEFPKDTDVDYAPYFKDLRIALETGLAAIKIPEAIELPPTDLAPVLGEIKALEKSVLERISKIPPPKEYKELDLSPVTKLLSEKGKEIVVTRETLDNIKWISFMLNEFRDRILTVFPAITAQFEKFKEETKPVTQKKSEEEPLIPSRITRSGKIRT